MIWWKEQRKKTGFWCKVFQVMTGFWCKVFCPGNEQDRWQSEGDQKHDRPESSPGAHQDQVYGAAAGATTKWQPGGPVRLRSEPPLSVFSVVAFLSGTLWGHTVYAVAHWQKHSRGLEDCVYNYFFVCLFLFQMHLYPCHMGSHTLFGRFIFHFWRVDAVNVIQGAYHDWRQSSQSYAVCNNILM